MHRNILLVDHLDSFVHTLANYFRTSGRDVRTLRAPLEGGDVVGERRRPGGASPGPGRPEDFDLAGTLAQMTEAGLPAFGVCLGLQGMVEFFGGRLGQLDVPMHGKASAVKVVGGRLFDGLPESFTVGRYHSLFALPDELPDCLEVTAMSEDGVIMAVEHRDLPLAAVQFHPESIMSLGADVGARLVANVARLLGR